MSLTLGAASILVLVAGFFLYHSLNEAKLDAVDAAKREAQHEVSAALATPNIQQTIDQEVRQQVKGKVDREITDTLGAKLRAFDDEQKSISDANILSSLVRAHTGYGGVGNPIQLHQLISLMYDSPYQSVRDISRNSLQEFAKDFIGLLRPNALGYVSNNPNAQLIMDTINKPDTDALNLFDCFYDMKKLTGWDVMFFDIRGANAWCRAHDCKLTTPTR